MKNYARKDLEVVSNFLLEINDEEYSKEIDILSGASIGQHLRHIIEFYLAVLEGVESGIVCYDNRKRNILLETDRHYAIRQIATTIKKLADTQNDDTLVLRTNYDIESNKPDNIKTSLKRELGYCIEHSIHHQALIKIGVRVIKPGANIHDNFGVAPATIRYRRKLECAQ